MVAVSGIGCVIDRIRVMIADDASVEVVEECQKGDALYLKSRCWLLFGVAQEDGRKL